MSRRYKGQYRYGAVPTIFHARSKFDLGYSHKSTMNVGDLVPLYVQEIAPGDSFTCDASVVTRLTSSFLKPVMDNLFMDVMFFFVPSRTIFNKWAEIFGENNEGPYARKTVVNAPTYHVRDGAFEIQSGDLANYLGIPVGFDVDGDATIADINILPFRAYAKIYNEWFRDENLVDPVNIQMGDTNELTEVFNHNPFGPDNYFGKCARVSKLHDYFSQVLVSPQKGDPVQVGTAVLSAQDIPVVTSSSSHAVSGYPLMWVGQSGGAPVATANGGRVLTSTTGGLTFVDALTNASVGVAAVPGNFVGQIPEQQLGAVNINDLRFAFQLQKMLERDATFGTRYTEFLQSAFSVTSPDGRLQRSEFLGGRRFPINVLQTNQTSESTTSSPLGNVAGWSLSNGRAGYTKGFTEHGYVIGMFCLRQFHTYQQGVERFMFRSKRVDYLDPLFTTIGYQPVFTKELYLDVDGDTVFGYAPAYEDMRCRQNRVSGQLSTSAGQGLDIWHFADYYDEAPVLGKDWIEEKPLYVDRTISVPSETVDQFIVDVYFKQTAIRVLPVYGEPGLIDHH